MGNLTEKKSRQGTRCFVDSNGDIVSKECSKCLTLKDINLFFRSERGLGGRQADCKECHSKYHLVNRDENLQKKRSWYRANRERVLENNRRWLEDNLARVREYKKLWLSSDRAKKAELPSFWTEEDRCIATEYFGGCALTGNPNFEWDHVLPISSGFGGTVAGNMLPLCKELNASKGSRNIFDWYRENRERFSISEERFNKTISYLAVMNGMSEEEYEQYVYGCYNN